MPAPTQGGVVGGTSGPFSSLPLCLSRSTVLWLVDGGYHAAQFLLFGLVLGLWH